MFTIRSYTDTRCEFEIAKSRLRLLTDKKEELYCKYFPITTTSKEVMVDGGEHNNDKMADYLHELHEIDIGTGKSLDEEIIYQQAKVNQLQEYLQEMNESLAKMSGLEYKLYYEIVIKGVSISKAVDNIATTYNKDTRTIWKNYYNKIKKDVKKVMRFSYNNQA